jgi:glycosyltransferase involved in cell wall biosynthesis
MKKKVLILYNNLFHYRIPIFNLLAERYDLTVAYTYGKAPNEDVKFQIEKLPAVKFFKRLVIHKDNIFRMCQDFDVVIAYGDIAFLKYSTLPWHRKRKFKVLFWSIGVSASYDKRYDQIKRWDRLRDFFYRKADALVFYSDYPIPGYLSRGFQKEKLFVVPNTVKVEEFRELHTQKDTILFIGTLYLQKGLLSLLKNYKSALAIDKALPVLNIIGGGDEFETVESWIKVNNMEKNIILQGPIFDSAQKAKFFQKAFACISPEQAGLSVLESMGYGVPFITSKDSITGGERLNITHGLNGVLLDNIDQLHEIILDISKFPQKYITMGQNAKDYYWRYRKPSDMANGLFDAIQYVLQ